MPPADELLLLLLLVLLVGGKKAAASSSPPAAPAAPASTSGQQIHAGDLLTPAAHYRASIKLTGIEAAFGTADAVKSKLEGAGFGAVVVADQGDGNFEATGQWTGGATAAKFPPQVVGVWRL